MSAPMPPGPRVPALSSAPAPAAGALTPGPDASFRGVQRRLAQLVPGGVEGSRGDALLEVGTTVAEPARLIGTVVIEGGALRARRVTGDPEIGFAAFLDGTQASRVVHYADGGIPVIHGTVAAVVRERRNRRLTTWRHLVRHALYAPRALVGEELWAALVATGVAVTDTLGDAGDAAPAHPFALRDAAIHHVQAAREVVEQQLAMLWCAGPHAAALLIDGGISGAERVARASCTVGVVKSHRTLYAEGDALQTILRLRRGERSSVFRVTSPKRTTVASWYLRLRDPAGHDPMWGLVRVEIAHPDRADEGHIGVRADEVSRWILAEVAPLALPDPRWDKMVYGVRDCEEFLRAVT